jgi:putative Mn2+ efflux pump MntP
MGPVEWLGPAAVGSYGIYVLTLAWQGRRLAAAGSGAWLALGLPLCLSLDNLVAGLGSESSAGSAALAALGCGLTSGCLSLVGLRLGAAVAAHVRVRAEYVGGASLVALTFILIWRDALA